MTHCAHTPKPARRGAHGDYPASFSERKEENTGECLTDWGTGL